jgi:ribosomal protein S18
VGRNPKAGTKKGQDRRPKPGAAGGRPRRGRPKICVFCSQHATWVDYKDVGLLGRFMNDRGRIKARGATGTCAQHQRDVASAVKTARELALLPYAVRTGSNESRRSRGGNWPGPTTGESPGGEEPEASPDSAVLDDEADEAASDEHADSPAAATA